MCPSPPQEKQLQPAATASCNFGQSLLCGQPGIPVPPQAVHMFIGDDAVDPRAVIPNAPDHIVEAGKAHTQSAAGCDFSLLFS